VARAGIHQKDGIIVGKFLKTSQLVEIGQEHRADRPKEDFGIDLRLSIRFQNEVCVEMHTMIP
jgi:hypothetical protein